MQKRDILRAFGLFFSVVYFCTNCAFAHAPEATVWDARRRVAAPAVPVSSLSTPFDRLPAALGTLRRRANAPLSSSERIVLHIQDVHGNAEAQRNIGLTIQTLIDENAVDLIALEGAFGPLDFSAFRSFPHRSEVEAAAREALERDDISGPAFTALTSARAVPPVVGVDDRAHYDANVHAVRRSWLAAARLKEKCSKARADLARRKSDAFGAPLSSFDAAVQAYRDGKTALGDYVRALASRETPSPEMKNFIDALNLEAALDVSAVDRERAALLERLVPRLSQTEASDLTNAALASRLGKIPPSVFHERLTSVCARRGVDLAPFLSLKKYFNYIRLTERIDTETMFDQLAAAERRIYGELARTPEQKKLVERSRVLYLRGKLLDFALTKKEWAEYRASARDAETRSFEKFYSEAEARDGLIAENLLCAMDAHHARTAVLVTGGFHSSGVEDILKRRGVADVAFVPRLTKADRDGAPYLSLFAQEKAPLDKLFEGEKLFLSQEPFSAKAKFTLLHRIGVVLLQAGTISFSDFTRFAGRAIRGLFVLQYRFQDGRAVFDESLSRRDGSKFFSAFFNSRGYLERYEDLSKDFVDSHPTYKDRGELRFNQRLTFIFSDLSFISLLASLLLIAPRMPGIGFVAYALVALRTADFLTLNLMKPLWHNGINEWRLRTDGATSSKDPLEASVREQIFNLLKDVPGAVKQAVQRRIDSVTWLQLRAIEGVAAVKTTFRRAVQSIPDDVAEKILDVLKQAFPKAERPASTALNVSYKKGNAGMSALGAGGFASDFTFHIPAGREQEMLAGLFTVEQWMDLALADPQAGFFGSGNSELGHEFSTMPMGLSPYFGRMVCHQLMRMWQAMGRPSSFHVVEPGGGNGILSRDILAAARDTNPEFYNALNYVLVDVSPRNVREANDTNQEFLARRKIAIVHESVFDYLEKRRSAPFDNGVVLTNELFDNIPAQQVRFHPDGKADVAVLAPIITKGFLRFLKEKSSHALSGVKGRETTEANIVILEKDDFLKVRQAARRFSAMLPTTEGTMGYAIAYVDAGHFPGVQDYIALNKAEIAQALRQSGKTLRATIAPRHRDLLTLMTGAIKNGFIIAIDYMEPTAHVLDSRLGSMGVFKKKSANPHPVLNLGEYDITYAPDATYLEKIARALGFKLAFFGSQSALANGSGIELRSSQLQAEMRRANAWASVQKLDRALREQGRASAEFFVVSEEMRRATLGFYRDVVEGSMTVDAYLRDVVRESPLLTEAAATLGTSFNQVLENARLRVETGVGQFDNFRLIVFQSPSVRNYSYEGPQIPLESVNRPADVTYNEDAMTIIEAANPGTRARVEKILTTSFSKLTEGVDYDARSGATGLKEYQGRSVILNLKVPVTFKGRMIAALKIKGIAFDAGQAGRSFDVHKMGVALGTESAGEKKETPFVVIDEKGIAQFVQRKKTPFGGMVYGNAQSEYKMSGLIFDAGFEVGVPVAEALFKNEKAEDGGQVGAVVLGLPSAQMKSGSSHLNALMEQYAEAVDQFMDGVETPAFSELMRAVYALAIGQGRVLAMLIEHGFAHQQLNFSNWYTLGERPFIGDTEGAKSARETTPPQFFCYAVMGVFNSILTMEHLNRLPTYAELGINWTYAVLSGLFNSPDAGDFTSNEILQALLRLSQEGNRSHPFIAAVERRFGLHIKPAPIGPDRPADVKCNEDAMKIIEAANPGTRARVEKILTTSFSKLKEGVDYDARSGGVPKSEKYKGRSVLLKLKNPVTIGGRKIGAIKIKGATFDAGETPEDFDLVQLSIDIGLIEPTDNHDEAAVWINKEGVLELKKRSRSALGAMKLTSAQSQYDQSGQLFDAGFETELPLALASFPKDKSAAGDALGAVVIGLPEMDMPTAAQYLTKLTRENESLLRAFFSGNKKLFPQVDAFRQHVLQVIFYQGEMLRTLADRGFAHLQLNLSNWSFTAARSMFIGDTEGAQSLRDTTPAQFFGYVLLGLSNSATAASRINRQNRVFDFLKINWVDFLLAGFFKSSNFGNWSVDDISAALYNVQRNVAIRDKNHPFVRLMRETFPKLLSTQQSPKEVVAKAGTLPRIVMDALTENDYALVRRWMEMSADAFAADYKKFTESWPGSTMLAFQAESLRGAIANKSPSTASIFGDDAAAVAPLWEWIFQLPTLLAVFCGADIVTTIALMVISSIVFALAHQWGADEELTPAQLFVLFSVGFMLTVALVTPFIIDPSFAWTGIIFNVKLHYLYNAWVLALREAENDLGEWLPLASIVLSPPGLLIHGASEIDRDIYLAIKKKGLLPAIETGRRSIISLFPEVVSLALSPDFSFYNSALGGFGPLIENKYVAFIVDPAYVRNHARDFKLAGSRFRESRYLKLYERGLGILGLTVETNRPAEEDLRGPFIDEIQVGSLSPEAISGVIVHGEKLKEVQQWEAAAVHERLQTWPLYVMSDRPAGKILKPSSIGPVSFDSHTASIAGDEHAHTAPFWEWIFQLPTLLATLYGADIVVILSVAVVSSALFALAHRNKPWQQKLFLFAAGLALTVALVAPAEWWNGLFWNIALHGGYNKWVFSLRNKKKRLGRLLPLMSVIEPEKGPLEKHFSKNRAWDGPMLGFLDGWIATHAPAASARIISILNDFRPGEVGVVYDEQFSNVCYLVGWVDDYDGKDQIRVVTLRDAKSGRDETPIDKKIKEIIATGKLRRGWDYLDEVVRDGLETSHVMTRQSHPSLGFEFVGKPRQLSEPNGVFVYRTESRVASMETYARHPQLFIETVAALAHEPDQQRDLTHQLLETIGAEASDPTRWISFIDALTGHDVGLLRRWAGPGDYVPFFEWAAGHLLATDIQTHFENGFLSTDDAPLEKSLKKDIVAMVTAMGLNALAESLNESVPAETERRFLLLVLSHPLLPLNMRTALIETLRLSEPNKTLASLLGLFPSSNWNHGMEPIASETREDGNQAAIYVVSSPDGRFVFSTHGRELFSETVYDDGSLNPRKGPVPMMAGLVSSFGITPDGQFLFVGNAQGKIRIWKVREDGSFFHLDQWWVDGNSSHEPITAIAAAHDSRRLFTGDQDGLIWEWDLSVSGNMVKKDGYATGHPVVSLVVHPSLEILFSVYENGNIFSWSTAKGVKRLRDVSSSFSGVTDCKITADGKFLFFAFRDGRVVRRRIDEHGVLSEEEKVYKGAGEISHIAISPNGKFFFIVYKRENLEVLRVTEKELLLIERSPDAQRITSLAVAPNGHFLWSGHSTGVINTWKPRPMAMPTASIAGDRHAVVAPFWEWIFQLPTLLATLYGADIVVILSVAVVSSALFALAHRNKSWQQKLFLFAAGLALTAALVAPADWWNGLVWNVAIHGGYNKWVLSLRNKKRKWAKFLPTMSIGSALEEHLFLGTRWAGSDRGYMKRLLGFLASWLESRTFLADERQFYRFVGLLNEFNAGQLAVVYDPNFMNVCYVAGWATYLGGKQHLRLSRLRNSGNKQETILDRALSKIILEKRLRLLWDYGINDERGIETAGFRFDVEYGTKLGLEFLGAPGRPFSGAAVHRMNLDPSFSLSDRSAPPQGSDASLEELVFVPTEASNPVAHLLSSITTAWKRKEKRIQLFFQLLDAHVGDALHRRELTSRLLALMGADKTEFAVLSPVIDELTADQIGQLRNLGVEPYRPFLDWAAGRALGAEIETQILMSGFLQMADAPVTANVRQTFVRVLTDLGLAAALQNLSRPVDMETESEFVTRLIRYESLPPLTRSAVLELLYSLEPNDVLTAVLRKIGAADWGVGFEPVNAYPLKTSIRSMANSPVRPFLFVGLQDGKVQVFEFDRDGNLIGVHQEENIKNSPILCFAVSADGQSLFVGDLMAIRIWDIRANGEIAQDEQTIPTLGDRPYFLALGKDGETIFSGHAHGAIQVWRRNEQNVFKPARRYNGGNSAYAAVISRNEKFLFVANMNGTIDTWAILKNGDLLYMNRTTVYEHASSAVMTLSMSPDGNFLFVGEHFKSPSVMLSVSDDGKLTRQVADENLEDVVSAAFSDDGRLLFTAHSDHTVRAWRPKLPALASAGFPLDTAAVWAWFLYKLGVPNPARNAARFLGWSLETAIVVAAYFLGARYGYPVGWIFGGIILVTAMHVKRVVVDRYGNYGTEWVATGVWRSAAKRGLAFDHLAMHFGAFVIYFAPLLAIVAGVPVSNPMFNSAFAVGVAFAAVAHAPVSRTRRVIKAIEEAAGPAENLHVGRFLLTDVEAAERNAVVRRIKTADLENAALQIFAGDDDVPAVRNVLRRNPDQKATLFIDARSVPTFTALLMAVGASNVKIASQADLFTGNKLNRKKFAQVARIFDRSSQIVLPRAFVAEFAANPTDLNSLLYGLKYITLEELSSYLTDIAVRNFGNAVVMLRVIAAAA